MKIMIIIETEDEDVAEQVCEKLDDVRYDQITAKAWFDYRVSSDKEERRDFLNMDTLYKHLVTRKEHLVEKKHQEADQFSDPYYLARLDEVTNILVHFEEVKL